MKTNMQPNVMQFFDEATQTFGAAMRTGAQMQGEATRWWGEMLQKANPLQTFQTRAQNMTAEAKSSAQKGIEQYMELIDRSYRTSMELLCRAFEPAKGTPYQGAQHQMQDFLQQSLGAMRSNARMLVQINTRIMQTMSELANFGAQQANGITKKTAAIAAEPIKQAVRAVRPKPQRKAAAPVQKKTRAARPRRATKK